MEARRINAAGLSLIKAHEGLEFKAYPDPGTGGKPYTIGYGHTKGVKLGMTITAAQAQDYLIADLGDAEAAVSKLVTVPLNDNQFAALVSFVFNVGTGAFQKSTLLKKLNAGNYAAVPSELNKWVNGGGKKLPGLVRRRQAEGQLFDMPSVAAPAPVQPVPAPIPAPVAPKPVEAPPVAPQRSLWAALLELILRIFKRK